MFQNDEGQELDNTVSKVFIYKVYFYCLFWF